QPRGDLAEAARAVRGGLAHRARSPQRAARAHPRRAQRRRHAAGGGRGHLPAGDLRRHARRGRGARRLREGARGARRAVSGRGERRPMTTALDTPVTQADREAEEAIVATLGRAFPDWGFLGEEFGAKGATDIRWIIDPIDGTKNFVRRIPVWATLLALEAHGEIVAGVILNPVT